MEINENMTQRERSELFGRLIDVMEDWLDEKGFSPKDFSNNDQVVEEDRAIIYGEDYDRLAEDFSKVIGISRDCVTEPEWNRGMNWAEREVKLACKRENSDRKDGEWD